MRLKELMVNRDSFDFLTKVVKDMTTRFGIDEDTASDLLIAAWADRLLPHGDMLFHESIEHWSSVVFHKNRTYWRTCGS